MEKLSFTELVEQFTNKFGAEWCNSKSQSEQVMDTFIDYCMSKDLEQFDYEKVNNLKAN